MKAHFKQLQMLVLVIVLLLAIPLTFVSKSFANNTPQTICDPYSTDTSNESGIRFKVKASSNSYYIVRIAKTSGPFEPYLPLTSPSGGAVIQCALVDPQDSWARVPLRIRFQNSTFALKRACYDLCIVDVNGVSTCNLRCGGGGNNGSGPKQCVDETKTLSENENNWTVPAGTINPDSSTIGQLYCRDSYNNLCCHSGEDSTYSACCPIDQYAADSHFCCPRVDQVANPTGGSGEACGSKCCFSNEKCVSFNQGLCCPVNSNGKTGDYCGTKCCAFNEKCVNSVTSLCKPKTDLSTTLCGSTICASNQVCVVANSCCASASACGSSCCAANEKCDAKHGCIPLNSQSCGTGIGGAIRYCNPDLYCAARDIGEGYCCKEGMKCGQFSCKIGETLKGQSCYCGDGAACPANEICCRGSCRNPLTDPANCGNCGLPACTFGQICSNGVCTTSNNCNNNSECSGGNTCQGNLCICPIGTIDCHGQCVDLNTDNNHCGGCDTRCFPGVPGLAGESCNSGDCS